MIRIWSKEIWLLVSREDCFQNWVYVDMSLHIFFSFNLFLLEIFWVKYAIYVYMHAKSLQSCPTLWDPMDNSPPGSSAHGILQARILEWFAMPSSRGSSWPRDWTLPALAGEFFTTSASKSLNGKTEKWDILQWGFEILWHILGNLEVHKHV